MNIWAYLTPGDTLSRFNPYGPDTNCQFCGVDMLGWHIETALDHVRAHAVKARIVLPVVCGCIGTVLFLFVRILFFN